MKRRIIITFLVGLLTGVILTLGSLDLDAKGLTLTRTSLTTYVGSQTTLKAKGTKKVTWSSSDSKVVKVTSKGVVKALKNGTAVITAKSGESEETCKVTVRNPKLSKTSLKLALTKTKTLSVTDGGKVKWSSSNKRIATVSQKGVVKAKKAGTVTIKAKTLGKTLKCKVSVKNPSLSSKTMTLALTHEKPLKVNYGYGTIKWSSSNKKVAKVNAKGVVTAVKKGTATITAKVGKKKLKCKVTVTRLGYKKIAVASKPDTTSYYEGHDLDVLGGQIKVTYNDSLTDTLDLKKSWCSGYDKTKTGKQTITVTYKKKTTTFKVNVKANVLKKIKVTTKPKVLYTQGDALDLSAGVLTLTYADGSTKLLDLGKAKVSGYDASFVGKQKVKFTYDGISTTLTVTTEPKGRMDADDVSVTSLFTVGGYKSGYQQGGAVSGDDLFVFSSTGAFNVYRMGDGSLVGKFVLDKQGTIKPHCNTVCFSNEYYEVGDPYPLLYVNAYNTSGLPAGQCYVHRILVEEEGNYSTSLVQTITIGFTGDELWRDSSDEKHPYGNFVVDTDHKKLYVCTQREDSQKTRFFRFDLPDVSQANVTLAKGSVEKYFDTPFIFCIQDTCYADNALYVVSGLVDKKPRLWEIDLNKEAITKYVDFTDLGLNIEPEVVCLYNGATIVSYKHVYKVGW